MNEEYTYQPEDIEELLLNKSFSDLLPEEKTFVLSHLESAEAYKQMRETLLAIKKTADQNDLITPETRVKDDLLLLLDKKRRRGAWFTLNGLWAFFFPENQEWFRKPAFQLASLALIVMIGFIGGKQLLQQDEKGNLAYHPREKRETQEIKPKNEVAAVAKDQKVTHQLPKINETQLNDREFESVEEELVIEDMLEESPVEEPSVIEPGADMTKFDLDGVDGESINGDDLEERNEIELNVAVGTVQSEMKKEDVAFSDRSAPKRASQTSTISSYDEGVSLNSSAGNNGIFNVDDEAVLDFSVDKNGDDGLLKDEKSSGTLADDDQIIDLLFTTL